MQELLKCTNLSKNYGAGFVLDDINISLPTGRIIGLLGPNGSGKTTFLKICAGLLSPTKGGVTIDGNPVGVDTSLDNSKRQGYPDRYERGGEDRRRG